MISTWKWIGLRPSVAARSLVLAQHAQEPAQRAARDPPGRQPHGGEERQRQDHGERPIVETMYGGALDPAGNRRDVLHRQPEKLTRAERDQRPVILRHTAHGQDDEDAEEWGDNDADRDSGPCRQAVNSGEAHAVGAHREGEDLPEIDQAGQPELQVEAEALDRPDADDGGRVDGEIDHDDFTARLVGKARSVAAATAAQALRPR